MASQAQNKLAGLTVVAKALPPPSIIAPAQETAGDEPQLHVIPAISTTVMTKPPAIPTLQAPMCLSYCSRIMYQIRGFQMDLAKLLEMNGLRDFSDQILRFVVRNAPATFEQLDAEQLVRLIKADIVAPSKYCRLVKFCQ
jgi:hypothetical protein